MDFAPMPITMFYDQCLSGAKARGFNWVVSLIARESDVDNLYFNLKRSWGSLDSITEKYFLFMFAGKENLTEEERWNSRIADQYTHYVSRYNDYITIINKSKEGEAVLSSRICYDWRRDKDNLMKHVERTQTDAISSLKRYFHLKESDIPCLVFTSILANNYYFVKINSSANDIYKYFKDLFNDITPFLDDLDEIDCIKSKLNEKRETDQAEIESMSLDKSERILYLYEELTNLAKINNDSLLLQCVINRQYYKFKQPIRGKLSKYIDLSKEFEKKNHKEFKIEDYSEDHYKRINKKNDLEKEITSIGKKIEKLNRDYEKTIHRIDERIRSSVMSQEKNNGAGIRIEKIGNLQINSPSEGSTVYAPQYYLNTNELQNLITNVRNQIPQNISPEEKEEINDSLDNIESEVEKTNPKKSILRFAKKILTGIKGTAEFGAAIAALISFIQPYL